jgi:hypothetical protein
VVLQAISEEVASMEPAESRLLYLKQKYELSLKEIVFEARNRLTLFAVFNLFD